MLDEIQYEYVGWIACFSSVYGHPRYPTVLTHAFPTRRSSEFNTRENGRGACSKKCFDQSLESFHNLGTLDIAPPYSHKRVAETGQVPHSALSAHILDIIDGHSSPVPVHFLQVVRMSRHCQRQHWPGAD